MIPRAVVPPTPPPALPSAPPADEGYDSTGESGRGVVRPHSVSPFVRNVRIKTQEDEEEEQMDFDAISTLLDFATRKEISTVNSFLPLRILEVPTKLQ